MALLDDYRAARTTYNVRLAAYQSAVANVNTTYDALTTAQIALEGAKAALLTAVDNGTPFSLKVS